MATKQPLLIILTVALLVTSLAGCIGESDDPLVDGDTQGDGDSGATDDNATADTPDDGAGSDGNNTDNATGSPPEANLTAKVATDIAPANVTFTVDGSEPDGDALEWTLDWDGDGTIDANGTELPTKVEAEYDEPGNYTAELVVTDKDGSGNATVEITIVAPDTDDGMCHRPDALAAGPIWIDVREVGADATIWVYQESNGVEGLQVGGSLEQDAYKGCANPDQLIF